MCIIIQREAGFTIPKDKFLTAVENNPHGWGVSVPEWDGRLTTIREVPDEVNAEELYSLLHTEFKNDPVLLHLRWTTAGETILRNAHPFPILEYETDGVDLRMAHNGTIHSYKPGLQADNKWESDTRVFVRQFVRPLFKRLIKGNKPEELLNDLFVYNLLDHMIPGSSVLAFMDGFGNTMQVNGTGNGGEYEDGWWYSNTYSFKEDHRSPPSKPATQTNGSGMTNNTVITYNSQSSGKTPDDPIPFKTPEIEGHAMDTKTELFSDQYELKKHELYGLTDDWIALIVEEAPDDAILLIKELLLDCYTQEITNKNLSRKLTNATRPVKAA